MKLFVSPHNDDAVLFGAFTLQRERPVVLTVYDSYVQVERGFAACSLVTRRNEDMRAVRDVLGCSIQFAAIPDSDNNPGRIHGALEMWNPEEVWIPMVEDGGHPQHNAVGAVALDVFRKAKLHRYLTYTQAGKSASGGRCVPFTGEMVRKKLMALAEYRTQIDLEGLGCTPHFVRDQREYVID